MNAAGIGWIGADKTEVPTPALLLDLDLAERNIARMSEYLRNTHAALRPHFKTHKTPLLSHLQLRAGAIGITCQTVGEAEVLANAGITDILISNQVAGVHKVRRLARLANWTDLKVAVDSAQTLAAISRAAQAAQSVVGVLVEVNIGQNRCGVDPGTPVLRLAEDASRSPGVEFLGLMGYEGHCVFIEQLEKRKLEAGKSLDLLVETKSLVEKAGIECRITSAGGTGTFAIASSYPQITEIQAGSYVTMDMRYSGVEGVGGLFLQALTVLTTVLSRPNRTRVVMDAGMKSITPEFGLPQPQPGRPDMAVYKLSEEHSLAELRGDSIALAVGDVVELIPSHGCTTINLFDYMYGVRNGIIECILPIAGRGKSA